MTIESWKNEAKQVLTKLKKREYLESLQKMKVLKIATSNTNVLEIEKKFNTVKIGIP